MAHHLLDLVALQMADEVQRRAVIGVLAELLDHLLDPVLPQHVDAGGDGLPAGSGVVHLAGAHQGDLFGVPAGLLRSGLNICPDLGNVFCNGHTRSNFPSYLIVS